VLLTDAKCLAFQSRGDVVFIDCWAKISEAPEERDIARIKHRQEHFAPPELQLHFVTNSYKHWVPTGLGLPLTSQAAAARARILPEG
jgi:hypothetical protein